MCGNLRNVTSNTIIWAKERLCLKKYPRHFVYYTDVAYTHKTLFMQLFFFYNDLILSESPSLIHRVENATYMQTKVSSFPGPPFISLYGQNYSDKS